MSDDREIMSSVWAEFATTNIPNSPIVNASYRNTELTRDEISKGQPFGEIGNSADWNQILYIITKLLKEIDTKGVPSYSNQINYEVGSLVTRENIVYLALKDNGPNTRLAVPSENTDYWLNASEKLINSISNTDIDNNTWVVFTDEVPDEVPENLCNGGLVIVTSNDTSTIPNPNPGTNTGTGTNSGNTSTDDTFRFDSGSIDIDKISI